MDFYLGSIVLWPMRWIPEYWAVCDGSLLQIQQYQALYSLLGTVYGGNGTTNFALPDLRGLLPVGSPQTTTAGIKYGTQMGTFSNYGTTSPLPTNFLPAHNHTVTLAQQTLAPVTAQASIPAVSNTTGAVSIPGTGVSLAQSDDSAIGGAPTIYSTTPPNTTLKPFNVSVPGGTIPGQTVTTSTASGSTTPVNLTVNVPGVLTLNYIICTNGLYPMRP